MNVLSLFDGMSCGQIALDRAGIEYENYFSSEIDKFAIKTTQHNYPNTIQVGDVSVLSVKSIPKIDLLIGGSPCQGFSFSGKQLNFNDHRSKLFFEFVRILKEANPKYWVLENVVMKKEFEDVITHCLGASPVEINSSLVSAQNRRRLYWANFDISQPEDRKIFLKDVLLKDSEVDKKYCLSEKAMQRVLRRNWSKPKINPSKSGVLSTCNNSGRLCLDSGTTLIDVFEVDGRRAVNEHGSIIYRRLTPIECCRLQTVPSNYFFDKKGNQIVSDTQIYKMLGNGWTVDVISHIFNHIK